jgi:two-component system OmpR family sensor kinase
MRPTSFCGFSELNKRHESRLARGLREREELVERLRASNHAKDEFLSLVSHELRTPLTTIGGNANVLRRHETHLDAESRAVALDDIISSSERLNRAVDDMLLLAEADRGKSLDL